MIPSIPHNHLLMLLFLLSSSAQLVVFFGTFIMKMVPGMLWRPGILEL